MNTKRLVLTAFVLGVFVALRARAQEAFKSYFPSQSTSVEANQEFQTDLFTGAFTKSVPIDVPPARGDFAPQLALNYNSSGGNGWCGLGWSLEVGTIQRDTRKGVPRAWNANGTPKSEYDDAKGFVFSVAGASSPLVDIGNNEFRAEIERRFLKFKFETSNNSWTVTEPNGTQHFLGETLASRVTHPGFTNSGRKNIFLWSITRSKDFNNNEIRYTYIKDLNHLYLSQVAYNANTTAGNVLNATHTVTFTLEDRKNSGDPSNWDDTTSFTAGFKVTTRKRLKEIAVTVAHASVPIPLVRKYRLAYTKSPTTSRSLLASVTQFGEDGTTALPVQNFEYSQQTLSFQDVTTWGTMRVPPGTPQVPDWFTISGGSEVGSIQLRDVDRDGFPDRVLMKYVPPEPIPPSVVFDRYYVQYNNGKILGPTGFDPGPSGMYQLPFQPPVTETNIKRWARATLSWNPPAGFLSSETMTDTFDINGDGFFDRVHGPKYTGADNALTVELGTGVGFANRSDFGTLNTQGNPVFDHLGFNFQGEMVVAMNDINGDGLPDRVMLKQGTPFDGFRVQLNTGTGFGPLLEWDFAAQYQTGEGFNCPYFISGSTTFAGLYDMNGDGLPDRLFKDIDCSQCISGCGAGDPICTKFIVQFNNGSGFEAPEDWEGLDHPEETVASLRFELGCPTSSNTPIYLESMWIDESPATQLVTHTKMSVILEDINGDHLLDRVMRPQNVAAAPHKLLVQINNGRGFDPVRNFTNVADFGLFNTEEDEHSGGYQNPYRGPIASKGIGEMYTMVSLSDMNADGLIDRVMSNDPFAQNEDTALDVQLSSGPFPDLLIEIKNGLGGSTEIDYLPSTRYDNRDKPWTGTPWASGAVGTLPFPVQTVSVVRVKDGMGQTATTTYAYKDGLYDFATREFRGFRVVTVVDPLLMKTETYFHQGGGIDDESNGELDDPTSKGKKGMPYRVLSIGSDNNRYHEQLNKIVEEPLGNGRVFPFVAQTVEMDYMGNGNNSVYKASATSTEYDFTTGNVLKRSEFGQVDQVNRLTHFVNNIAVADDRYHHSHFTTFAAPFANIVDQPDRVWTSTDALGNIMRREVQLGYNGGTARLYSKSTWVGPGTDPQEDYFVEYFQYDAWGNVIDSLDGSGVLTHVDYDTAFHVLPAASVVDPFGLALTTTGRVNPKSGLLEFSIAPDGVRTDFAYDKLFRMTRKDVTPFGGTAQWREKADYQLRDVTGPLGPTLVHHQMNDGSDADNGLESWMYFDGIGRAIQLRKEAETGEVRVTDTRYNERGATVFEGRSRFDTGSAFDALPGGHPGTTTTYDPIGRVASESPPGGSDVGSPIGPTTYDYKAVPNDPWSHRVTDAELKYETITVDAFRQTIELREKYGTGETLTKLEYDESGNVTKIIDDHSNDTVVQYDRVGRKSVLDDPNAGLWRYEYDGAGRPTVQIDARGCTTRMTYDDAGRLIRREYFASSSSQSPESSDTYEYDTSDDLDFVVRPGQLYRTIDSAGSMKRSYDTLGRLVKELRHVTTNNKNYVTERTYDVMDRMLEQSYPNEIARVRYVWDTGANLSQVVLVHGYNPGTNGEVLYTAGSFDDEGKVLQFSYSNGTTTDYDYYDNSRRLRQILVKKPNGASIQDLVYTYDKASNILTIADGVMSGAGSAAITSTTYDDLHRLRSYTRNGVPYTIDIDSIGNLLRNDELGTGAYEYDTPQQKPHAVSSANGRTYLYDANGNMTNRNGQTLAYDCANRLTSINGGAITFGYDESGKRLWKRNGNNLVLVLGDIYEVRGGVERCHVVVGTKRICTFMPPFDQSGPGTIGMPGLLTFQFNHADHLNSNGMHTNRAGNAVQRYVYRTYGSQHYEQSTTFLDPLFRFTDQQYDPDSGLYDFDARYYDPEIGRFVQPDTVIPGFGDSQALNRYAYAKGNPLKYNDPSGHGVGDWWNSLKRATVATVQYAGDVAVGFGQEAWNTAKGTYNAVVHLDQTVEGIGQALAHPIVTSKAVYASAKESVQAIAAGDPHAIGAGIFQVGSVFVGGAGAIKAIDKTSDFVRATRVVAKTIDKVDDVPRTPIWTATKAKSRVQNAFGHWQKHRAEFPEFQNAKQYVEGAKSFINDPPPGTLTKTRANGDTLLYNQGSNTFAVRAANGAPRTMFRPTDGIDYWNKQ